MLLETLLDVRIDNKLEFKQEFKFNVQCFTSTETIRAIRDGEPRTATSTFTQLLNSGKRKVIDRTRIARDVILRLEGSEQVNKAVLTAITSV